MNLVEKLLTEIANSHKHIVIIGDTMVDRWVHGHLAECQDGCPKFVQESVVEVPGGAANAERCLSGWNVRTSLYGFATNDGPVKTRYVEGGKIVFRADDDRPSDRGTKYEWARKLASEMVGCAAGVLLSDYDKGFLTPEFIREVAELCKKRSIPCVADCKRAPEVYEGCVLKGNSAWDDKYGDGKIRRDVLEVITLGECVPQVNGELLLDFPSLPLIKCVNHVGAGDCFAAHLTLALSYGFSLKESAALAHSAGRVYVQHPHNKPPTPTEIAADIGGAV